MSKRMGNFGIYFDTRFYGEKRLQPSRRKRDAGKRVSSKKHFMATWSYIKTRQQERGLNVEGERIKLADEQKAFNPLSPSARMSYFGLPRDPQAAWQQCQASASENVTFRYYEFGPDPSLVQVLFELDRADLVRSVVVEGFYEGLQAYCTAQYGAREPPSMAVAYHEKFDQYGRPQPHLHALSEATLTNGDYDRVEMKLFKEQLIDLREVLDEQQGLFLDRHLPDIAWRELYQQRRAAWELERERIEQEGLGKDIEATLVATGIIQPALEMSNSGHAEVVLMDNPPLDLSRPSDFPPVDFLVKECDWLLSYAGQPDLDEDDDLALEGDEPDLDFDDFD